MLDDRWREATRDRLASLVVDAVPFPVVLTPLADDQAELFTTAVAMAVAIAAGEDVGSAGDDWIGGFWDPDVGMFHATGPPPEVESYFATLVLTRLGDRPLEEASATGMLDWATGAMWRDPFTGEPIEFTDDLGWVGDVLYQVRLVELIGRTAADPAVADRAMAILESRPTELEAVCRTVGQGTGGPLAMDDMEGVGLLVDIVQRAGGSCELPAEAVDSAQRWVRERLGSGFVETAVAAIDAFERAGYVEPGTTLEAIERAETWWRRASPEPGASVWQMFDLVAPAAHRRNHRLELPGWMMDEVRAEIGRRGTIPNSATPDVPTTVRAIHALSLAGDERSVERWWAAVDWDDPALGPVERLWLMLAIDPTRVGPTDVEAVALGSATSPAVARVVALGFDAAAMPCDSAQGEALVGWLGSAAAPTDVVALRDLAEVVARTERCASSGAVTSLRGSLTAVLETFEGDRAVAAWTRDGPRDVISAWLGAEAGCALWGEPRLDEGAVRSLVEPALDPGGMARWAGAVSVDATYAVLRLDDLVGRDDCGGAWWSGLAGR